MYSRLKHDDNNICKSEFFQDSEPAYLYVSGLWIRTLPNPGSYVRSLYGPGHLYHAQSWIYYDHMKVPHDEYKNGEFWKPCKETSFHGCLDKYPIDGNMMFHSEYFKEWKYGNVKN